MPYSGNPKQDALIYFWTFIIGIPLIVILLYINAPARAQTYAPVDTSIPYCVWKHVGGQTFFLPCQYSAKEYDA